MNFTNEGGVGGTVRLLKNITGMWLLEGCKKVWDAAGMKYSYGDLCAMAKAEPDCRAWIDPDDALFTSPSDMTAAVGEYCRRTGQVAPTTVGACTRTVLEGLALKYRLVLDQLGAIAQVRFTELRVIGGGCRNAVLNQFTADATGCRVLAGPVEATALGNIAMQIVALGWVASIDEARALIDRWFPVDTFEPAGSARWDRAYLDFQSLAQCFMNSRFGGAAAIYSRGLMLLRAFLGIFALPLLSAGAPVESVSAVVKDPSGDFVADASVTLQGRGPASAN